MLVLYRLGHCVSLPSDKRTIGEEVKLAGPASHITASHVIKLT
jgi:hypothetical protein